MRSAALVSGGLDSCILLRELASRSDEVVPLYVRAGLVWEAVEMHWLKRFLAVSGIANCGSLSVLELPVSDLYGNHWSTTGEGSPAYDADLDSNYLPGRNLLLLAKAAVFCALHGIHRIAMALLRDNPFPDADPAFFRAFEETVSKALSMSLTIETPYRDLGKAEVIRRGQGLPLDLTFSCLSPVGLEHCGDCTKCAERQRAFSEASVPDPTRYHNARRSMP